MSDFYNEQSDTFLQLEGKPGQPPGATTIQGAKMHTLTQTPALDIHGYAGRIYYGQSQFYVKPAEPRFVSSGNGPVRLLLAGHFWYRTKPKFELTPNVTLTLIGPVPAAGVQTPQEAYPLLERMSSDKAMLAQILHASAPHLDADGPEFASYLADAATLAPLTLPAIARGLDESLKAMGVSDPKQAAQLKCITQNT